MSCYFPYRLFRAYISTSRTSCAVPNVAVLYTSLISCFPGIWLRYLLNNFEVVPVARIITGITLFLHSNELYSIIIIIIIIIMCYYLMQSIYEYNYTFKTNHFSRVCNVAAIL